MKTSELDKDAVKELDDGLVLEHADGTKVILGAVDTVAFRSPNGDWFVAEAVIWDRVVDYRPQKAMLEGLAEKWILAHGTDVEMGMTDDIANELELEPEVAAEVFQLIRKAGVTITFG